MLLGLHVKNLALIEKAEVEFAEGLNILTGETGAGKSIIIGSVGLALGAKASKSFSFFAFSHTACASLSSTEYATHSSAGIFLVSS